MKILFLLKILFNKKLLLCYDKNFIIIGGMNEIHFSTLYRKNVDKSLVVISINKSYYFVFYIFSLLCD